MLRVFVCSPYRGDVAGNASSARACCRAAMAQGAAPFAPHLIYPQMLDEDLATERRLGIRCGLEWLAVSDEVWVYAPGGVVSDGMRVEIGEAIRLGKPIRIFGTEDVCAQLRGEGNGTVGDCQGDGTADAASLCAECGAGGRGAGS